LISTFDFYPLGAYHRKVPDTSDVSDLASTLDHSIVVDDYTLNRVLTIFAEQEKIFESICNGACGYLLKKTPPARLLEAIREAHEGGSPMSPEIARKVVTLFQRSRPPERLDEQLTPQEKRLLVLLAEGHSYSVAAEQLNISINTVRNYIRSIYEKLHVHSKSEAVSKALRNHLIS